MALYVSYSVTTPDRGETDKGRRAEFRQEDILIPLLSYGLQANEPEQPTGKKEFPGR